MAKNSFETKKKRKINKLKEDIELNIKYDEIPKEDVYGFYIMNRMEPSNAFGIPMIGDFSNEYPNFIALYNHPAEYLKTDKTCIAFYISDYLFDDIDGIYEAIIHKDIELLKYYKWLLKDVKFIIGPDYSLYGNFNECTIINQLTKEAIVVGWMKFELEIIVYPNITYGNYKTFKYCFKNIYPGSNVAISLKGSLDHGINEKYLISAIKEVVDNIRPECIIAYSVASDITTHRIMKYALDNGIKVIIPDNTLKSRNEMRLKNNG